MFCPKCGTDNPQGATFCAGCGNPLSQATPEVTPAATYNPAGANPGTLVPVAQPIPGSAPNPYAGGVVAKSGSTGKLAILGVAAVAIVVLLVLLVRGVACSGGGAGGLNLTELVSGDADKATAMLSKFDEVKLDGGRTFTSDGDYLESLADLMEDLDPDDDDDVDTVAADIRKHSGAWYIEVYDEDYSQIRAKDVEKGNAEPVSGYFHLLLADDDLTCATLDKELAKYMDYDEVILGKEKKTFGGFIYSKDKDFIGSVSASELSSKTGIWVVNVSFYNLDEAPSYITSNYKDLKKNFDEDDYKDSLQR